MSALLYVDSCHRSRSWRCKGFEPRDRGLAQDDKTAPETLQVGDGGVTQVVVIESDASADVKVMGFEAVPLAMILAPRSDDDSRCFC